jgi:hypothetical protein
MDICIQLKMSKVLTLAPPLPKPLPPLPRPAIMYDLFVEERKREKYKVKERKKQLKKGGGVYITFQIQIPPTVRAPLERDFFR